LAQYDDGGTRVSGSVRHETLSFGGSSPRSRRLVLRERMQTWCHLSNDEIWPFCRGFEHEVCAADVIRQTVESE